MDKKSLTETDIRTKFITPAILGQDGMKWSVMTQVFEEHHFEQAWRVPFDQIKAGGFDLDLKNPNTKQDGPGDVDHLLPEYEKLPAQIAETRKLLKAQLVEALTRGKSRLPPRNRP